MDVGADVLVVGVERPIASVEAHPDVDLDAVGPRFRCQPALGFDCRGHALVDTLEDGEDPVPLGLLLVAAGRLDRAPDQRPVARQHLRPLAQRKRLGEPCRALDVREQEGHGPDGLGAGDGLRLDVSDSGAP